MWTNVKRKKASDDETKNIAVQVLTYNSKNFHLLKGKLDLERTMNGLGKQFKKSAPKNWKKNIKNQSEISACEQKTTSEKTNFCSNTVFSVQFKFEAKKFHAAKPLAISLHFLFWAWPKTLLQSDFKNHENVWTDLKKKTAPQYNSNSLNFKKKPRAFYWVR